MTNEPASADRDPARNLQVVLGGAGLIFFGWSWANFSGPFRLFIDLQLRYLGTYREPAAGIASAIAVAAAVALALVLLQRAYPKLSARAAETIVALVLAAASAAALWQVWRLWHEAAHMPRLSDPVRVVDLGSLGSAPLSIGHVRVVGTPDRQRQVLGYVTGRYALNSYWEAWVPMTPRPLQHDPNAPVRMVATVHAADRIAASRAVPDDPQGILLFDSVDTRTVYEVRQEGLDMPEHSFALYPDERVRFDKLTNAAVLGSLVALLWGLAAYGWIKERRGANATTVGSPARPSGREEAPNPTAANAVASLAPEPAATAEPAPASSLLQAGPARIHALVPPPGFALLCVLRDEPGVSSPSYKRVDVDGARVADLVANRYTVVTLWPGGHTLAVNTRISLAGDTVARFEVAAGDVVAYRLQIRFFGPMRLERMPELREVRAALARLKPAEPA